MANILNGRPHETYLREGEISSGLHCLSSVRSVKRADMANSKLLVVSIVTMVFISATTGMMSQDKREEDFFSQEDYQ